MINKNDLKKLKFLLAKKQEISERISNAKTEFERTIQSDLDELSEISISIDIGKNKIRDQAEVEFRLNPNSKKMAGGISVRIIKKLEYDFDKAFSWARDHDICLMLDKSAFEKIAKIQNIDFVSEVDDIVTCFPKKNNLEEED
jgi:hypothetical protein